VHVHVNLACQLKAISPRFDHQKVNIAVGSHLASRGGPEHDDLVRPCYLDNASDDLVQFLLVNSPLLAHLPYPGESCLTCIGCVNASTSSQ
jgi:hypothetical protein